MAALLSAVALCMGAADASAAPITEFSAGLPAGSDPGALAVGNDGNLWFVDTTGIGKVTPAGAITEFPVTMPAGAAIHQVLPGPQGVMWFNLEMTSHDLGRIDSSGHVTEIAPGTDGLSTTAVPTEMTTGPGNTVWFIDVGTPKAIGEIDAAGTVHEFTYPSGLDPVPSFDEISAGADGNIYVSDKGNKPGLVKVTPAGTVTEVFTPSLMAMPSGVGAGNNSDVWFTDQGSPPAIGRVTATGLTEFTTGLQTGAAPDAITAGPSGDEWFDDQDSGHNKLGFVTPTGQITEFAVADTPWDVVPGIDGDIWSPQSGPGGADHAIDRMTPTGTVTAFTAGLSAGADFTETNMVLGPDGNLWTIDKGTPKAIVRADVQLPPTATTGAAATITASTATIAGTVDSQGNAATVAVQYGTTPALGSSAPSGTVAAGTTGVATSASLTGLPASKTIFYRVAATNAYGTATGAVRSFTTAAAGPGGGPGGGPGANSHATTATFGNQRITLTTPLPTACTAGTLPTTLSSTAIPRSTATPLHFVKASFFIDGGVRHVVHRRRHRHGKTITVRVVVHSPNAIARKVPVTLALKLRGLTARSHTLKVTVVYRKTVLRHHHRHTVSVSKTLTVGFRVC